MKSLSILMKSTVLALCLVVLPVQQAAAKDATTICAQKILNGLTILIKAQIVSSRIVCRGKATTVEQAPKLAKRANKGVDKINKANEKYDCATNTDPDIGLPFPVPNVTTADAETLLDSAAEACDGM